MQQEIKLVSDMDTDDRRQVAVIVTDENGRKSSYNRHLRRQGDYWMGRNTEAALAERAELLQDMARVSRAIRSLENEHACGGIPMPPEALEEMLQSANEARATVQRQLDGVPEYTAYPIF